MKIFFATGLCSILIGCGGADHALVYFPPPPETAETPAQPSVGASPAACTIVFTSRLCVMLKGDNVDVGSNPEDPLCVDVDPFPLHISTTSITLEGSEFPDIPFEGHGLPAPIMINGKGDGTGKDNVGSGTIDAAGNISIENFSIFINALSLSAEIPGLTLTTGVTPELPDLQALTGKPPDASGAMTLVTGVVLGSLFEAADEVLMGASLTASFAGVIEPVLASCSGSQGKRSVEVTKIAIDASGAQTESPVPEGKRMEVSTGTFIADSPDDIGSSFETTTAFRVTNTSSQTLSLKLSPQAGPFFLDSLDPLTRTLESQQSFLLKVTFRPRAGEVEPGEVREAIMIGQDLFELVGVAREASGMAEVDVVADDGSSAAGDVDTVDMGEIGVAATMERGFFACEKIRCGNHDAFTQCTVCPDPATQACELLPLTNTSKPFGEVDARCTLVRPDDIPLFTIDLRGTAAITIPGGRKVLALRNRGVTDLTIESVSIEEETTSPSRGEFSIPEGGISVAGLPASLPLTLPPFQAGVQETTLSLLVVYQPRDLRGSEGNTAGVGSAATDRAVLRIVTSEQTLLTDLEGATTILEVPTLELHFKTPVGDRMVADGESYPLRSITTETRNFSVPLFLRVPDTAPSSMRVTGITIGGNDADSFEWDAHCSLDASSDLRPIDLSPPGFDMAPGASTIETMPFFGCVNFHRNETHVKKIYAADLTVTAQELDAVGSPVQNPDGSIKTSSLSIQLLAALHPLAGKYVLRVTQTMSMLLNSQFPSAAAVAAYEEIVTEIEAGRAMESDIQIFTTAIILDPFDEETITDVEGNIMSTPGDGMTAVFRALDTHPISQSFEDQLLYDYTNLLYDSSRPEGERGIFEDYPNVPETTKANGWRIFTTGLSYPGPLAPLEQRPLQPSFCEIVDPCSQDGFKQFTPAGVAASGGQGACAFFYVSGAAYASPAFHSATEMPDGVRTHFCNAVDQPQQLTDAAMGRSTVDGHITVEEMGLRFFGPTFVHHPFGPVGNVPPLDTVFHLAFTSGVLKPQTHPSDLNVLPDEHIDTGQQMYKINLTDPDHVNPPLCPGNMRNRTFGGRLASTWRYLAPLLSKDEEGKIPAGCSDDLGGGVAFLHGRPIDPDTHAGTFVAAANFGSSDDLTFAFKDVMVFIAINGWLCDPNGDPEQFEGEHCYDATFNERDAIGQISAIEEE